MISLATRVTRLHRGHGPSRSQAHRDVSYKGPYVKVINNRSIGFIATARTHNFLPVFPSGKTEGALLRYTSIARILRCR